MKPSATIQIIPAKPVPRFHEGSLLRKRGAGMTAGEEMGALQNRHKIIGGKLQ